MSMNETLSKMIEAALNASGNGMEVDNEKDIKEEEPCSSSHIIDYGFGARMDTRENLVWFGGEDYMKMNEKELARQKRVARQLERLQFSCPGEQNKVSHRGRGRPKRAYNARPPAKKGAYHDKQGALHYEGQKFQLCDCLDLECPGCFTPCTKCKNKTCVGVIMCQSNRSRFVSQVETNGTEIVYNPIVPQDE